MTLFPVHFYIFMRQAIINHKKDFGQTVDILTLVIFSKSGLYEYRQRKLMAKCLINRQNSKYAEVFVYKLFQVKVFLC